METEVQRMVPVDAIEERPDGRYEVWISKAVPQQQVYNALQVMREVLNEGGQLILVRVISPEKAEVLRGQIAGLMRQQGIGARVVGAQGPQNVKVTFRCSQCGMESTTTNIQAGTEHQVAQAMIHCHLPMLVKEVVAA